MTQSQENPVGTTTAAATPAPQENESQTWLIVSTILAGVLFLIAGYETIYHFWQAVKHSIGVLIWMYFAGVLLQLTLLLNGLRHRELSPVKDVTGVIGSFLTTGVLAWQGAKKMGVPRHYRRVRDAVGGGRSNA